MAKFAMRKSKYQDKIVDWAIALDSGKTPEDIVRDTKIQPSTVENSCNRFMKMYKTYVDNYNIYVHDIARYQMHLSDDIAPVETSNQIDEEEFFNMMFDKMEEMMCNVNTCILDEVERRAIIHKEEIQSIHDTYTKKIESYKSMVAELNSTVASLRKGQNNTVIVDPATSMRKRYIKKAQAVNDFDTVIKRQDTFKTQFLRGEDVKS